jgi:hypothetical protein
MAMFSYKHFADVKLRGSGGFGDIYTTFDQDILKQETKVLNAMSGKKGFPFFYGLKNRHGMQYIVMEQLGESLQ